MTASLHHTIHRAGACYQAQQRCVVAMRPVVACTEDTAVHQVFAGTAGVGQPVFSVWNKKTGTGNQN